MLNKKINIAIADDHEIFREGLKKIISELSEATLVTEAKDGKELLDNIDEKDQKIDVVLLDLNMPVKGGIETLKVLKENFPATKVLILTIIDEDDYILKLLDLGANGYLLKNSGANEVKKAILTVQQKDHYFNEHISEIMLSGLREKKKEESFMKISIGITDREKQVLDLLCKEFTTSDIANTLFLSVRTIETHRKNLMEKLGAKNTAGIIYRAVKEGLVE